jgi:hypothetical protein
VAAAEICQLTGLLDTAGWPEGTRFIVRRESPHPGAQQALLLDSDPPERNRRSCATGCCTSLSA